MGHIIATVVGVAVCKLFQLSDNFESIRWAGGALSCAAATSIMALTKTVHPPAGATALLVVVDANLVALGWYVVPVIILGAVIMTAVAMLVNNIERQFPLYWWSPESLRREVKEAPEHKRSDEDGDRNDCDPEAANGAASQGGGEKPAEPAAIVIRRGSIVMPRGIVLGPVEQQFLHSIQARL